jgi:hypothetical protein
MPGSKSEVLVGRRYLERGFLDAALKLLKRNAEHVTRDDWTRLADRLLERNRLSDVVAICEVGGVPLPRQRLLEIGDAHLRRRSVDEAIRLYELAGADQDRWLRALDVLTGIPDRQRQAVAIVERHLGGDAEDVMVPPHIRVVK